MNWSGLRDFCLMLQDNGVDAVCVHPRLKQDRLKRPARWEYIGKIKKLLDIPVIGNGDVNSPQATKRMFELTGCDAVMIGRAAVKSPWLFRQIANSLSPDLYDNNYPDPADAFKRFIAILENAMEPEYTLPLLKRFTFYFSQNYAFGHTLWSLVHNADSLATATYLANEFLQKAD
jgi:tRNA-dihydrouridine synthase